MASPRSSLSLSGVTYRLQYVCCGKRRCLVCRGKRYEHGPYWYAEWWEIGAPRGAARYRSRGRVRTKYIGKALPADVRRAFTDDQVARAIVNTARPESAARARRARKRAR